MEKNTALSANGIIFISEEHRNFYQNMLDKMQVQDVYIRSLFYTLGISSDTRNHIHEIFDFKERGIMTNCIDEGWQTGGSLKAIRLAFNLYSNHTPTIHIIEDDEEKIRECRQYSVSNIFCNSYAIYSTISNSDDLQS